MKVAMTCTYCNHKWTETVWNRSVIEGMKCPQCKDKNLIPKELSEAGGDVFGYRFSPPFPPKERDDGFTPDYWDNRSID